MLGVAALALLVQQVWARVIGPKQAEAALRLVRQEFEAAAPDPAPPGWKWSLYHNRGGLNVLLPANTRLQPIAQDVNTPDASFITPDYIITTWKGTHEGHKVLLTEVQKGFGRSGGLPIIENVDASGSGEKGYQLVSDRFVEGWPVRCREVVFKKDGKDGKRRMFELERMVTDVAVTGDAASPVFQRVFDSIRFEPPAEPGPSASVGAEPLDLFPVLDVKARGWSGRWLKKEHQILTAPEWGDAMLQLPFQPPESYELTIEVERVGSGTGMFGIGVVVEGSQTLVALDGNRGRISTINAKDPDAPDEAALGRGYRGQVLGAGRHLVRVEVKPGAIRTDVDGATVLTWSGKRGELGGPTLWSKPQPLGFLATNGSEFVVSRLEVRRL